MIAAAIIYRQNDFEAIPWLQPLPDDVIARVVNTHDCEGWQHSGSPETLPTRGLRQGQQVRLQKGLMEISYRSGPTVVLEGPCVYEVRSKVGGKLYSGQIMVTSPGQSDGFAVEAADIVARVSGGRIAVRKDDAMGVMVTALNGQSQVMRLADSRSEVNDITVPIGKTARLDHTSHWILFPTGELRFDTELRLPKTSAPDFTGSEIRLSNLFDDSMDVPLVSAVQTDGFQAAAETTDLGIAAVRDGGLDVDFYLAEGGVRFNLLNVGGGGPRVDGLPSNDSYRSTYDIPIRTIGQLESAGENLVGKQLEDGIGMCANEMLTFDLDELRDAGNLGDVPMRFIVDRAGVNDFYSGSIGDGGIGSVRLVVIVSNSEKVLAGYVNGAPIQVIENARLHRFDCTEKDLGPALKRTSPKVAFDVPVPPDARYLTLAAVMVEMVHDDQAVFSGARLELEVTPDRGAENSPGR